METKKLNDPDKEIMSLEPSNEDTTGVGRSYECTFCKRGFTNAQALGGHMNIHRKDKAKAKQKSQDEASNSIFEQKQQQHEQTGYCRSVGGEVKYQIYLPSSNPNMQSGNYLPFFRPPHFERHVDANLSLRIGISSSPPLSGEDGEEDSKSKENEVDLELRLGHDP